MHNQTNAMNRNSNVSVRTFTAANLGGNEVTCNTCSTLEEARYATKHNINTAMEMMKYEMRNEEASTSSLSSEIKGLMAARNVSSSSSTVAPPSEPALSSLPNGNANSSAVSAPVLIPSTTGSKKASGSVAVAPTGASLILALSHVNGSTIAPAPAAVRTSVAAPEPTTTATPTPSSTPTTAISTDKTIHLPPPTVNSQPTPTSLPKPATSAKIAATPEPLPNSTTGTVIASGPVPVPVQILKLNSTHAPVSAPASVPPLLPGAATKSVPANGSVAASMVIQKLVATSGLALTNVTASPETDPTPTVMHAAAVDAPVA